MKDTFVNRLLAWILSITLAGTGRATYLAFRYLTDANLHPQTTEAPAVVQQEPIRKGSWTCLQYDVKCRLWRNEVTLRHYNEHSQEVTLTLKELSH